MEVEFLAGSTFVDSGIKRFIFFFFLKQRNSKDRFLSIV